ncbi:helix-turn-helix transcriptional regulator [Aliidiomarina halalkaliphila]|uniref:Helix-turn-helix transcriptional regulator n=1 Tax=Aliidiomarina halalkaliphila TaxID=2593535 RepID=A0A552X1I6_9GAMM|nr:helix-turn-helix transcriptional regulator [Aliidiomarina halalkaliphila]TRW48911.1 helix-turn-helix transcriptional regulator [Aliidiomarina halalkaliphila]
MLTPLGKEIRKRRIDVGISLRGMAERMGVSAAYLSALETGKKSVAESTLNQIANALEDQDGSFFELIRKRNEYSKPKIELTLQGSSDRAREAAVIFARRFNGMEDDEFDELIEFINRD